MPTDSAKSSSKLIHIGIECEQIEDQVSWGVSRLISKLLEEISRRAELQSKYRFHLYFKSRIPDYPFLDSPIFVKEVIWQPLPRHSFVFYYYVFLPIRLWFARLNAMYYPNYMLPIIHPPQTPSLVMLADDIYYEMRSPVQRFHHKLAYWVFGYWAVWRVSRFMAISETSKNELVRLFGITPSRISVNLLAVQASDTDHIAPHPRPFILFVGQAFPRRHLRETLLAFEQIAPDFPDLDFVFIGPDRYRPSLLDALAGHINKHLGSKRVFHISHVADEVLARYYANGARAFTYISSREAFGLPPLEALGHGSIPVLADNALSRELFGDHAFFVSHPDSVDSIAATLRQALTDTTKRESILKARDAILARYTWSGHADRFLHTINEILRA